MTLTAIVLWVHVIVGTVWIAASAGVVIAALAVAQEPRELGVLIGRTAGKVKLIGMGGIVLMPITGILNLENVARARRIALSSEFMGVLSLKLGLFALMAWAVWRAAEKFRGQANDELAASHAQRLVRWYSIVASAGAVALVCGVWLAGIR